MAKAGKSARQRRRAKSLMDSMREFVTPAVFKQVRNATPRRKSPRWDLHPLLYVLLLTTYCSGDSLPEKFEASRGFYVACGEKRKRPGTTFTGFEKAVTKLPMLILRAVAARIRGRVEAVFGDRWKVGGFVPFGCDGTRQACPRTEELERRLAVHQCRRSPAIVLGDGGDLLSLEVGKRGIFQDLQADLEEGDADEPHRTLGPSRGGSLDDRHAVVALPRRPGDARTASRQAAGDVQSPAGTTGGASRYFGREGTPRAFHRKDHASPARTTRADQCEAEARMAATQEPPTAPSAPFAEAD